MCMCMHSPCIVLVRCPPSVIIIIALQLLFCDVGIVSFRRGLGFIRSAPLKSRPPYPHTAGMKTIFASAAVVAAGAAPNVVIPTFSEFLARFGKSYEGTELSVREAIYANNVRSGRRSSYADDRRPLLPARRLASNARRPRLPLRKR